MNLSYFAPWEAKSIVAPSFHCAGIDWRVRDHDRNADTANTRIFFSHSRALADFWVIPVMDRYAKRVGVDL